MNFLSLQENQLLCILMMSMEPHEKMLPYLQILFPVLCACNLVTVGQTELEENEGVLLR
ncbi:hypothetical protein QQP08_022316, partial [Theobroma cacao]